MGGPRHFGGILGRNATNVSESTFCGKDHDLGWGQEKRKFAGVKNAGSMLRFRNLTDKRIFI